VLFSATAMQAAALYLSISANASGDYRNFFAPAGRIPSKLFLSYV
jgi:hypothetical protein